jgi:Domain of unknown function (DUF4352)/Protein of unknown function (DUF2510)
VNLRYAPAVTTPATPAGWYPDPDGSGGQRYWDGSGWTEHRSPATEEPAQSQPAAASPESDAGPTSVIYLDSMPSEQPSGAPRDTRRRNLIIGFGAACAVLLAVLVAVVVYGVFFDNSDTISASSSPSSTSKSASPTTSSGGGWGNSTETESESPTTASGSGPQASDGGLTFAVTGVETAPSVKYQDAPVEKTAQGEYLVVHLTVSNSGDGPGTYLGTLQKLKAGGTTYDIDDEATAYLDGTWADLNPGDSADIAIAFDVPPETSPESLELHGDPMGAGVEVPLS